MGFKDRIDVMILCGGSATDLPEQGPAFARHFNTVDSYDTHAKIPEYFEHVNAEAVAGGNVSRSEEHTSELQSRGHLVCRLLLETKKKETHKLHECIETH